MEIKCLPQKGIGLCVNFKRRDYNVWLEDVHDDGVHARNLQIKQFLYLSKKISHASKHFKDWTYASGNWYLSSGKNSKKPRNITCVYFFFLFLRFGRYWIIIVYIRFFLIYHYLHNVLRCVTWILAKTRLYIGVVN